MSEQVILAGSALRRLRKRERLTQADMAGRLGISPSYLNLIERNRRGLSARVAMQLMREFAFDPASLEIDDSIGGTDGLVRRLSDERFADLALDREEIDEFLTTMPQLAAAFARTYDDAGGHTSGQPERLATLALVRSEIDRWRNHFADLDRLAEQLADEMRLSRADIGAALVERLRERHQLAVRILPRDVLPETLRRLDLHARQVQLTEMLPAEGRNFELAVQLAHLEFRDEVETLAAGAQLSGDTAAQSLFERHLYAYFAAAILMPYRRFLRACNATGYDLPVLERRFGVSFEQLAHRLTTLQRVGERGLPFFMVRIDRAGQFSKRYIGASKASFLEAEATCPLWNIHRAFARPGDWEVDALDVDGSTPARWLTLSRSVDTGGSTGDARFVVALGVELPLAQQLAQARNLALDEERLTLIGPGCRRCLRETCRQRSRPPDGVAFTLDPTSRLAAPFSSAIARLKG